MQFEYKLIRHKDMGYAMLKAVRSQSGTIMFWQQITKWYQYYGNLKRFNPDIANVPCLYTHV